MNKFLPFFLFLGFISCTHEDEISSIDPNNWEKRRAEQIPSDSLQEIGKTYLSVYSEIYSITEHKKSSLTATISMRNTSEELIFIHSAKFYDTHGELIRNYFEHPIYLNPLETVEIIIDETDDQGGTGGNFIFEWQKTLSSSEPLFESIMISTTGQQGLSFTSQGVRIK